MITHVSWKACAGLVVTAALAFAATGCQSQGDGSLSESTPGAEVSREDIDVTVGGVGRIVHAGAATRTQDPSTSSGTPAPANAVYPQASGNVLKYVVVPGQRVAFGQPLLLLDDGGTAAAAVKQAQGDLVGARLELEQLLGSQPADVSAAQLDVRRAQAELEVLLGGTPAARARAIRAARRNVELAQNGLDRILAPPSSAEVRAVEAEVKKAESEMAALKKPAPPPSPKAVRAAEQAVTVATQRLAKVTGPPDPVAVAAAQQEVAQAESNLQLLLAREEPPVTQNAELAAARAAVNAAKAKRTQITGPPDAATVSAAEAEVRKAEADLEALTKSPPPPSAEAVAAAAKSLDAANLKLAKLKGPPNAADVTIARLELERAQAEERGLRIGASPAAKSAAEQAVRSSQAKLARLSGSPIGIARLKVTAAETRLNTARFAERVLTVRSPSTGTVTALLSAPGAPVDRSTPIATVTNLATLAVNVDLSEFDVAQVKLDQKAVIRVDALGGKAFQGKVAFVALTGTETAGVVTFPVRVTLPKSGGLKPGMNVSVRIIVAQKSDVVQVPVEAVTRDEEGNASVTVADESGQETERPVKLGLANNEMVEIVKGVQEGESLVIPESPETATEEP